MVKTPSSFYNISWVAEAGLLVFLLLAAYLPVLQNGFIWDDDRHLTDNPFLTDLDGLKRLWLDIRSRPQYSH
mgnify:FL=1